MLKKTAIVISVCIVLAAVVILLAVKHGKHAESLYSGAELVYDERNPNYA